MSDRKRNQKKEGAEEQIFTVPYDLSEIKEKIVVSTNTPSNPSKEQI